MDALNAGVIQVMPLRLFRLIYTHLVLTSNLPHHFNQEILKNSHMTSVFVQDVYLQTERLE